MEETPNSAEPEVPDTAEEAVEGEVLDAIEKSMVHDALVKFYGMSVDEATEVLDRQVALLSRTYICDNIDPVSHEEHGLPIVTASRKVNEQAKILLMLAQLANARKMADHAWDQYVVFRGVSAADGLTTVVPTADGEGFEQVAIKKKDLLLAVDEVACVKTSVTADGKHAPLKGDVKNAIIADFSHVKLPVLTGVSALPKFARASDGGIHVAAEIGYDVETQTFIGRHHDITRKAKPSKADVAEALKMLDSVLGTFTYATPGDRANAYALLLTVVLRETFMLAPGFGVVANNPGTGKSFLVEIIGRAVEGKKPITHAINFADEGMSARSLPNHFSANDSVLFVMDEPQHSSRNQGSPINNPTINNALTAGRIMARGSYQRGAPMHDLTGTTVTMMGNGLHFAAEMARRMIMINLENKGTEHFSPDAAGQLVELVENSQDAISQAIVTLVDNWQAKGMPKASWSKPSFEEWSHVVGGILEAADITDMDPGIKVPENDVTVHYAELLKWIMANVPGSWDGPVFQVTAKAIRETIAGGPTATSAVASAELEGIVETIYSVADTKSARSWKTIHAKIGSGTPGALLDAVGRAMNAINSTQRKVDGEGGVVRSKTVAHGSKRGGGPAGTSYKITTDEHAPLDLHGAHFKA